LSNYNWAINKTISKDPEYKESISHLSDIKFQFEPGAGPIENTYSCFMLFVGRKYYIVKSKTCMWVEGHLNKLLKAYSTSGIDGKDLYFPIVKQIHSTGYYDVNIQFICQSDNPYEVIKAEYMALQEHYGRSLCLNKNKEAYTPKWDHEKQMFGWLTKNQYLNYKRLVKAHQPRSKKSSK
jgi:hypothetical protein